MSCQQLTAGGGGRKENTTAKSVRNSNPYNSCPSLALASRNPPSLAKVGVSHKLCIGEQETNTNYHRHTPHIPSQQNNESYIRKYVLITTAWHVSTPNKTTVYSHCPQNPLLSSEMHQVMYVCSKAILYLIVKPSLTSAAVGCSWVTTVTTASPLNCSAHVSVSGRGEALVMPSVCIPRKRRSTKEALGTESEGKASQSTCKGCGGRGNKHCG